MDRLGTVLKLEGLSFVKALLDWEKERFEDQAFSKGSTYEEINELFGPFPRAKAYPVYFAGDLRNPNGKTIFIGINPGYNLKKPTLQQLEQMHLEEVGLFNGYCNMFSGFFERHYRLNESKYYQSLTSFLAKYLNREDTRSWKWLQENVINLDFVPYHSNNANGLHINDPQQFRQTYLRIFQRILMYIQPDRIIFFNGFAKFKEMIERDFSDVFSDIKLRENFYTGLIDGRFRFIGLPFLSRPRVNLAVLADCVRDYEQGLRLQNQ